MSYNNRKTVRDKVQETITQNNNNTRIIAEFTALTNNFGDDLKGLGDLDGFIKFVNSIDRLVADGDAKYPVGGQFTFDFLEILKNYLLDEVNRKKAADNWKNFTEKANAGAYALRKLLPTLQNIQNGGANRDQRIPVWFEWLNNLEHLVLVAKNLDSFEKNLLRSVWDKPFLNFLLNEFLSDPRNIKLALKDFNGFTEFILAHHEASTLDKALRNPQFTGIVSENWGGVSNFLSGACHRETVDIDDDESDSVWTLNPDTFLERLLKNPTVLKIIVSKRKEDQYALGEKFRNDVAGIVAKDETTVRGWKDAEFKKIIAELREEHAKEIKTRRERAAKKGILDKILGKK